MERIIKLKQKDEYGRSLPVSDARLVMVTPNSNPYLDKIFCILNGNLWKTVFPFEIDAKRRVCKFLDEQICYVKIEGCEPISIGTVLNESNTFKEPTDDSTPEEEKFAKDKRVVDIICYYNSVYILLADNED